MSPYKAGFELDGEPEEKKVRSETVTAEQNGTSFSYKKGFELDQEPENSKEISAVDIDVSEMTTVEIDDYADEPYEETTPTRFWSSPLLWILLLVVVLGGLQVYQLLTSAFTQSLLAGGLWSLGITVVMGFVLTTLFKELTSVWKLKNSETSRIKLKSILEKGNGQDAINLCREMYRNVNNLSEQSFKNFEKKVQPHFAPSEVFEIYEQTMLSEQDRKAKKIVVRRSRENGVVVALSPIAWLDMAFTFARSLRMIREVAETYGYHFGLWGRLQLYRKLIKNIVFIGLTDLATDALMDSLGAETFAKLSSAVGQGLAAGIYSTRLGYMTIKAVRPIPVSKKVVTLAELRGHMITGALGILKDQNRKN